MSIACIINMHEPAENSAEENNLNTCTVMRFKNIGLIFSNFNANTLYYINLCTQTFYNRDYTTYYWF